MRYNVFITDTALKDLNEIDSYVSEKSSERISRQIYFEIKSSCVSLEKFPLRGHEPPELMTIKNLGILEIHCKVYRIFYRIMKKNVYIISIIDGRRNVSELLKKRLLDKQ